MAKYITVIDPGTGVARKVLDSKSIKNGQDVTAVLSANECSIREGKGSHRVARLPNGQTMTYYEHGDFPKGTWCSIIKVLKAAGLVVVLTLAVVGLLILNT